MPRESTGWARPGRGRAALCLLWLGTTAALTLTPGGPGSTASRSASLCVICGPTGTADAILNTLLFLPLGLALGVRRSPLVALVVGIALSCIIETTQLFIPGRFTNLGDVVWNGTGAGLGALLPDVLRRWLRTGPPLLVRVGALALPTLQILLAGLLLEPVRSNEPVLGQWTPEIPDAWHYDGRVLEAELSGVPVPDGPLPAEARSADALVGPFTLRARIARGRRPPTLAPVVRLVDRVGGEIAMLGVRRQDLVWHEDTWAVVLRFAYADPHLRRALARYEVGDTLTVAAHRADGDALCLSVASEVRCGLGVSPARGWAFYQTFERAPARTERVLDVMWMATLAFLIGVLGGPARSTLAGGGLLVALAELCSVATRLLGIGWAEIVGAALGVGMGSAARPLLRFLLEAARPGTTKAPRAP